MSLAPEEIPGLLEGWQKVAFNFYTLQGAINLHKAMREFKGGKLVLNIAEFPFKGPVAPLEFVYMADAYFTERGLRDQVDIRFVTPLPGAFTKPKASAFFSRLIEEKNIKITATLPTSKAGSVAHFSAEVMVKNFLRVLHGEAVRPDFDGHSNCFIETGFDKAAFIGFNYDYKPLPGKFSLPGLGPFSLLGESKANHWDKMMFKWVYWNKLISGEELPLEAQMSLGAVKK